MGINRGFFLHPLKNINVWSDGGLITTNNKEMYKKLKLLRNHGLIDRDTVKILGYNSRLDTIKLLSVIGFFRKLRILPIKELLMQCI